MTPHRIPIFSVLFLALVLAQGAMAEDARPIVDPTENVKALSEAANKRQDDLRALADRLLTEKLEAAEKLNELRYQHNRELREAEIHRLDDEMKLRADYSQQLSIAEAKRIDAIRAVDVNAVAVASTRATDQASVLATQVSQSAEALRALVATTAATVAASQQQLANTLSARLTTLEQAGYQAQGKSTISDPAFISLQADVRALVAARADTAGNAAGRGDVLGWVVGAIGLLIAFAGVVVPMLMRKNHGFPPQQTG